MGGKDSLGTTVSWWCQNGGWGGVGGFCTFVIHSLVLLCKNGQSDGQSAWKLSDYSELDQLWLLVSSLQSCDVVFL